MKYFNLILLLTIATIFSFGIDAKAQSHGKMEQLKSLKIGFITESLDLSPEEAADFWPIYNEHQEKIHKLFRNNRSIRHELKDEKIAEMSDSKATELLDKLLKTDRDILTEKEAIFKNLKDVLPPKKLIKLHKAESEFSRKILEQYRKRKEGPKK